VAYQAQYINNEIKLTNMGGAPFKADDVVMEHHSLVLVISGEVKIILANATYVFGAGDTLLFSRNLPATVIHYPKDGLPFRSVVVHLSTARLKHFYAKNKVRLKQPQLYKVLTFNRHPLLEGSLASLLPYFDLQDALPEHLVTLKIEEIISILRIINRDIDALLMNFELPGKIDLAGFMEAHYMFNMPMEKFGYMTGRSLTTFKRDFKKIFHTTPQKWLTQKRLELARREIGEKKRKPSDVYLEAGFENLSHFTYAFKKHFGYTPTDIA
jgi:AraC-like DNA-binding protein